MWALTLDLALEAADGDALNAKEARLGGQGEFELELLLTLGLEGGGGENGASHWLRVGQITWRGGALHALLWFGSWVTTNSQAHVRNRQYTVTKTFIFHYKVLHLACFSEKRASQYEACRGAPGRVDLTVKREKAERKSLN